MEITIKEMGKKVYGTSTINHTIRTKCKLSCDEMVVMLYLSKFDEVKKRPFTINDIDHMERSIGFNLNDFKFIVKDLKGKGFCTAKNNQLYITKRFEEIANPEIDEQFEQLWNEYNYKVNRNGAISMFKRTVKVVKFDYLLRKLKLYERHLSLPRNRDLSKMHLSTWLNPDNRRFDDEYNLPKEDDKTDKFVV